MKDETHIRAINESLEVISESVAKGIEKRQRTIGFHCSSAAVNLFEMFLHKQNLIDTGASIKHNWFASIKTASSHLPDFPQKADLLQMLNQIENKRTMLCYGKPQPAESIEEAISLLNKIKGRLETLGVKI